MGRLPNDNLATWIRRFVAISLFLGMGVWAGHANIDHRTQQGIFTMRHKILGQNLWSGSGYQYDSTNEFAAGDFATYPIWGYPIIVGLMPSDGALVAAQIMAVIITTIILFWKYLHKVEFWVLSPLILTVFLHASVKWPDTWYVMAIMWLLYAVVRNTGWIAFAAGIVAVNMRSDYLFLACFGLCIGLLMRSSRRIFALALLGAVVSLIPWFYFAHSLTSTNGGLVAFISLGQLPNNPWGIQYADSAGYDYVRSLGEPSAVTKRGNELLLQAAFENIQRHPGAYIEKVWFNLKGALSNGVYTGEFTPVLSRLSPGIFILLIWMLVVITIHQVSAREVNEAVLFGWVVLSFSMVWVSLLQYEPRHLNATYAILLYIFITSMCDMQLPWNASPRNSPDNNRRRKANGDDYVLQSGN